VLLQEPRIPQAQVAKPKAAPPPLSPTVVQDQEPKLCNEAARPPKPSLIYTRKEKSPPSDIMPPRGIADSSQQLLQPSNMLPGKAKTKAAPPRLQEKSTPAQAMPSPPEIRMKARPGIKLQPPPAAEQSTPVQAMPRSPEIPVKARPGIKLQPPPAAEQFVAAGEEHEPGGAPYAKPVSTPAQAMPTASELPEEIPVEASPGIKLQQPLAPEQSTPAQAMPTASELPEEIPVEASPGIKLQQPLAPEQFTAASQEQEATGVREGTHEPKPLGPAAPPLAREEPGKAPPSPQKARPMDQQQLTDRFCTEVRRVLEADATAYVNSHERCRLVLGLDTRFDANDVKKKQKESVKVLHPDKWPEGAAELAGGAERCRKAFDLVKGAADTLAGPTPPPWAEDFQASSSRQQDFHSWSGRDSYGYWSQAAREAPTPPQPPRRPAPPPPPGDPPPDDRPKTASHVLDFTMLQANIDVSEMRVT